MKWCVILFSLCIIGSTSNYIEDNFVVHSFKVDLVKLESAILKAYKNIKSFLQAFETSDKMPYKEMSPIANNSDIVEFKIALVHLGTYLHK